MERLPGSFFGPATLVELLRHRATHQADDIAFIYLVDGESEERSITYRELDRQARAIAAWLQTHDLVGERALLLYPPGLDFIAAFFGCLYAGVVAVPVYPPRRNRSMERIEAISDNARARAALTTRTVRERVAGLIHETPHLQQLAWLTTTELDPGIEDRWHSPDISGGTLAFLQYTSGSTGAPKGVMLTHANLMHNSALICYAFEHRRSGTGVYWLPSYHDMGLIGGIIQPIFVGRPNVMMSPMAFLQKPYRWLAAITKYRGTTSGGPNFAYDLCVRSITPEQRSTLDLSSWEVAFNGAEPVRAETIARFSEYFAPCGFRKEAFYPCYGLAESTLMVSGGFVKEPPVICYFDHEEIARGRAVACSPDDTHARPLVGSGRRLPDGKIVIADPETARRLPDGQIGEIWVQSPSVAIGYWDNEEATRETFQAYVADGEGPFMRTGDLGFLWKGELFVTGRIKDMIIVHGVNVYPHDIEQTVQRADDRLRQNAGACFAVERDGREQLIVVQEVERRVKDGFEPIFQAIRRAVSLEHELAVDAIVLIRPGTIPRTSSNKIQRFACRQAYLQGTLDVVAQWTRSDGDEQPLAIRGGTPVTTSDAAGSQAASLGQQRADFIEQDKGGDGAATLHQLATRLAEMDKGEPAWQAAGKGTGSNGEDTPDRAAATTADHTVTGPGKRPQNRDQIVEAVLSEVRRVARDRAEGLTLDTAITEIGLDSLERMEILASLEERFGGQFPEEILPELETCAQVVDAVEKYLGGEERERRVVIPPDQEIPSEYYDFDKFPEYLALKERLQILEASGLGNPFFTVHEGITNDRTIIGGREMINFSSYNYIGMSGDPTVIRAVQEAVERFGTSVSASRLVSGEKTIHRELEQELAEFLGTEAAVVFVGGHATNETVIGHLMGPGDLILHDALSHNSILQGAILSGARRRPFPHNDWRTADRLLELFRREYRRVLIVIEGVYSMDGDIPDLPHFIEIKKRHKALLMVDEAHSMGVLGETGRGIGEYFHVSRRDVDIWMGTLSKSFGSCGGFIAGKRSLVNYLKYTAPGFVFSVGLSPPNAAAALASLRLLKKEPQRVQRLQEQAALFLRLAKERGFDTGASHDSPVVPIIVGNSLHCMFLSQAMFKRGINVQPIVYPAVEERAARLRFFLTSRHTEEQIRYTIDVMTEEMDKLDPNYRAARLSGTAISGG
ncbi:MAG: aminotransferase class I/II-fold pyridoxal phosphate-dependent enzyme [Thermogutta sp.]